MIDKVNNHPYLTKNIINSVCQYYFKLERDFFSISGGGLGVAPDKPPANIQMFHNNNKHCVVVISNDSSLVNIIERTLHCAQFAIAGYETPRHSIYLMICKDKHISFAEYRPGYHQRTYYLKTGALTPQIPTRQNTQNIPGYDGIIGLAATRC